MLTRYMLLITSLILMLLLACSAPQKNQNKTVFKYNEAAGITSLDPAFSNRTENIWAVNQIFNGLVQLNDTLAVMPSIAKFWEIGKDGLEYNFHLRLEYQKLRHLF